MESKLPIKSSSRDFSDKGVIFVKKLKFGFIGIAGLLIQLAQADTWPKAKISRIVIDEVSGANCPVIRFVNVDNPNWNTWLTLNSPNAEKYLAVALSAMSLGKDVEIQFQTSTAYGYNGQLKWIAVSD